MELEFWLQKNFKLMHRSNKNTIFIKETLSVKAQNNNGNYVGNSRLVYKEKILKKCYHKIDKIYTHASYQ